LLLASAAAAAEPPASERFLDVKGWTGTFTMTTPVQQGTGQNANGDRNTWSLRSSSRGTVRLDHLVGASGHSLRWEGSGEATLLVDHHNTWVLKGPRPCRSVWSTQGSLQFSRDAHGDPLRSRLQIRRVENTYDFDFALGSTGVERTTDADCYGKATSSKRTNAESFYFSARKEPLPAAGLTLSGSRKLKVTTSSLWPLTQDGAHHLQKYDAEITWHLVPVSEEVEVVVWLEGYEGWRPAAGRDERTPGNELEVKARLQRSDGGTTELKARRFTFELSDTSREPGVAMNFPPAGSARDDFDLQFSSSQAVDGCTASGDGLQRCGTPPGEYAAAAARVASFDWGGWSTLKVTAELQDGRRLVGHLLGERDTTEILLPRRAKGSRIAEAWKQAAGLSLPDADDSDDDPEGDGRGGDGLALYQEYRGFIEGGKHVEGHPRRKDYFLQNRIGADAALGIQLFADLTGLLVHEGLLLSEMGDDRLIAFNSSQGDRVGFGDQHGVILLTDPDIDGANAWSADGSGPGPPGNTQFVRVQPRHKPSSVLTGPYELGHTDQLIAYDRAIVHELMHTASVWHHGEEDYVLGVKLQYPGGKAFPVDRPTFFTTRGGLLTPLEYVPTRIVHEQTGEDLAAVHARFPGWTPSDAFLDAITIDRWVPVEIELQLGAKHGRHSGHQDCVMRYAFAKVYPADGAGFFYWHDDEPIGLELCDAPAGTGVNAPGREPQPRYFDAAPGRGACRRQICVNDSLPVIVR
jgi:hypothetical protein